MRPGRLRSQITKNRDSKELFIFQLLSENDPKCEKLLQEYLDINGTVDLRDEKGLTPLMFAASSNNLELFAFLMDKGADIDIKDDAGYTAKDYALRNDSIGVISAIEEKDLILVTSFNKNKWAKKLLDKGLNIEEKDHKGRTPLMIAALNGNRKLCIELLQRGADINAEDDRGLQTLNYIIDNQNPDKKRFLNKIVEEVISSRHTNEARWNNFINPLSLVGEGAQELRYLSKETAANLIANIRDSDPEKDSSVKRSGESIYALAEEKINSYLINFDSPEEEDIKNAAVIKRQNIVIERKKATPPKFSRPLNRFHSNRELNQTPVLEPITRKPENIESSEKLQPAPPKRETQSPAGIDHSFSAKFQKDYRPEEVTLNIPESHHPKEEEGIESFDLNLSDIKFEDKIKYKKERKSDAFTFNPPSIADEELNKYLDVIDGEMDIVRKYVTNDSEKRISVEQRPVSPKNAKETALKPRELHKTPDIS